MSARIIRSSLVAAATFATPVAAFAHPGIGEPSGFMHGFSHPLSGIDHILAMVMVGVFAWQLGGRARWLLPITFVAVMAVGGAFGAAGMAVPFVEVGIAISVAALGAAVALNVRAPVAAAMSVVGLFALFHGHAHGTEMPQNAGGAAYAAGFMIATAILHVAGIGAGATFGKAWPRYSPLLLRSAGALASAAGVALLVGTF